jgi:hypothetical protein
VRPGAVTERNGRRVVFVVNDNRLRQIEVQVGRKIGELTEVRGMQPMKAGEQVVLDPDEKLEDGASVRPARK